MEDVRWKMSEYSMKEEASLEEGLAFFGGQPAAMRLQVEEAEEVNGSHPADVRHVCKVNKFVDHSV